MNVLSLFDGMSCGRLALERAGIDVTNYYASEIDKYAIKVATANWPDNINLGDVQTINYQMLPKIDLLIGGSPCQGFSFAGKRLHFDDPRSALFFEFVRLLKELRAVNPDMYFMLENVKMKKEYQDVISRSLGVEPICINSSLVSAQNRVRYYWTNIPGIEQPEDKNILLKNIIQKGVVDRDKSFCIDANYWKGGNLKSYFEKHRRQLVFQLSKINPRVVDVSISDDGIRPHQGDTRKSCLSEMGRLMFADAKKTYTITTNHMPKIIDNLGYRKLTPVECERLQTIPDNYTNAVSNTQRYKMLGNGWTVDVIAHIFKGLKQ